MECIELICLEYDRLYINREFDIELFLFGYLGIFRTYYMLNIKLHIE